MADITHESKPLKFVSKELELPLFLVSRNRIRRNYLDAMRNYIERNSLQYTRDCNQENAKETAKTKKWKHTVGLDYERILPCPQARATSFTRGLKIVNWKLAPNRYGMPKKPFEASKGHFGAFWSKEVRQKNKKVLPWKFYEYWLQPDNCSKYKYIFLNNVRSRRHTARCIISDLQLCYRNPSEPASNRYFPRNYTLAYNTSPVMKPKKPNPHIFYRRSSVPVKLNSIHRRNCSFEPGPGRYDIRFPNVCPCTWRLVYTPDLQMMIDREKRRKFRRLPYTKMKARNYCSPDWGHVPGHGHRRLFKMKVKPKILLIPPTKDPKQLKEAKVAKDAMKVEPKLFADARYIALINDPNRQPISFRTAKVLRYQSFRLIFHCMQKHGVRHKLGINKNVAFGSGAERFKSLKRNRPFTHSDLEKLRKSLPARLLLKDHPVTKTPIGSIKSKLEKVPKHMLALHELDLRKRLFKFLPLPAPKVLIREQDVHVDKPKNSFYDKMLDHKLFMKDPESKSDSMLLLPFSK